MPADFNYKQKKLDTSQVQAAHTQDTANMPTAASATAAAQVAQASTAASEAGAVQIDAAGQAAATAQAQGQPAPPAPGLSDRKCSRTKLTSAINLAHKGIDLLGIATPSMMQMCMGGLGGLGGSVKAK